MPLRQLLLLRHGETDGASSVRMLGATDADLSEEGRAQMRHAAAGINLEAVELVVASPLGRSWRSAWIVGRGAMVRLEADLREIDFGRWEGLTHQEIEARDPVRFADWQAGAEGFEFPGGEPREAFRERVGRGLERLLAADAHTALAVLHKGVIREIVRRLVGAPLPKGQPALGQLVILTGRPDGSWFAGARSSNPPALEEGVAA
jgi:broad specificity phosphatase PhoE